VHASRVDRDGFSGWVSIYVFSLCSLLYVCVLFCLCIVCVLLGAVPAESTPVFFFLEVFACTVTGPL